MRLIEKNELSAHVQRLRRILNRRVERRFNETFQIAVTAERGGFTYLSIQANASTEAVVNDKERLETCAVLRTMGQKRVLCAYLESWRPERTDQFAFNSASLTFFLTFNEAGAATTKQIFRLEWENWRNHVMPDKAAYPHWQFDRWLTASDTQQIAELRDALAAVPDQPVEFEPTQRRGARRPDLSWFTKMHFPSIAPWATSPILDLETGEQPHRLVPESSEQLEQWVDSALCYLHSEIRSYAYD
jgi:hypothetical protein